MSVAAVPGWMMRGKRKEEHGETKKNKRDNTHIIGPQAHSREKMQTVKLVSIKIHVDGPLSAQTNSYGRKTTPKMDKT